MTDMGGAGDDIIWGGSENDTLSGNGGNDIINGGLHNDQLSGNAGDDILRGSSGDDLIFGGAGVDSMYGGGGRDTIYFEDADAVIDGGAGFDRALVTAGSAPVNLNMATSNIEQVRGSTGNDVFDATSSTSFVKIFGGDGSDLIIGSAFGDRIHGQAGDDMLNGLGGRDRFFFDTGWGSDIITDFEDGLDLLDLTGAGITDFAQLAITQNAANAVISYAGQAIWLLDTDIALVDATDFRFATVLADEDNHQFDFLDTPEVPELPECANSDLEFNPDSRAVVWDLPVMLPDDEFDSMSAADSGVEYASLETFGLSSNSLSDNSNLFGENDLGVWDMF